MIRVSRVGRTHYGTERGGANARVGAIIDEINPTLAKLEQALGIDLRNHVLGSVGKRQFSGDIDVALDIPTEEIPAFVEKLKKTGMIKDIAQSLRNYDKSWY